MLYAQERLGRPQNPLILQTSSGAGLPPLFGSPGMEFLSTKPSFAHTLNFSNSSEGFQPPSMAHPSLFHQNVPGQGIYRPAGHQNPISGLNFLEFGVSVPPVVPVTTGGTNLGTSGPKPPISPSTRGASTSSRGINKIVCNDLRLNSWCLNLEAKTLIAACHGPRPPADTLKHWMRQNWEPKNIKTPYIQYLPNNYYLFFFYKAEHAFQVLSSGTWLVRNTPLIFTKWYKGFDPRKKKPTTTPVWVDLPDLPLDFYPWIKEIGNSVGKVLGQRPQPPINPKWDPQLLIEVDTSIELPTSVDLFDHKDNVIHSQTILYRNLPNSCFKCHKPGHLIKDCPELAKDKAPQEDKDGFKPVSKKNIPLLKSDEDSTPSSSPPDSPRKCEADQECASSSHDSPRKGKPNQVLVSSPQSPSQPPVNAQGMEVSPERSQTFVEDTQVTDSFENEVLEEDSSVRQILGGLNLDSQSHLEKEFLAKDHSPLISKPRRKKEKSLEANRLSQVISLTNSDHAKAIQTWLRDVKLTLDIMCINEVKTSGFSLDANLKVESLIIDAEDDFDQAFKEIKTLSTSLGSVSRVQDQTQVQALLSKVRPNASPASRDQKPRAQDSRTSASSNPFQQPAANSQLATGQQSADSKLCQHTGVSSLPGPESQDKGQA
ncbi:hypothetical protein L7F22_050580 [Adiantum nelumboides]|nr:hypothetical protein [Adiantum nelumboides]